MRKPFVLILLLFALISASAPDHQADLIWNTNMPLTWQDFRGKPDSAAKGDAASRITIKARPYRKQNQLRYDVSTIFHRDKSWCKAPSATLLAQEQLHFDIAELYARKARKKISSLRRQGVRDVHVYNTAISRIFDESNKFDARYDRETVHGASMKKQAEWEHSMKIELMLLSSYSRERWKP